MLVVNLHLVSKSSLTFKDSEPLMMTGNIFVEIISVLLLGGGKKTNAPGEVMEVKNISFFPHRTLDSWKTAEDFCRII